MNPVKRCKYRMSRVEKRALQIAVAIGSLVPIGAGAAGILLGLRMLKFNSIGSGDLDSHFRYLSGLLLAIGIGYATTVPRIETRGCRFRLLTFAVVLGGVGRLFSLLSIGLPSSTMVAALIMELLVAPGLALWQHRLAFQTRGGCSAWRPRPSDFSRNEITRAVLGSAIKRIVRPGATRSARCRVTWFMFKWR